MPTPNHEHNVALIDKLWVEYSAALVAGDIERWISLWAQGGVELSAGGLLLSGTAQIRAAYRPVMDLFESEMTISPEYTRIFGDRACSYGSYTHVVIPKEGGEAIGCSGRFLTLLEKQAIGSWRIAVACFNGGR